MKIGLEVEFFGLQNGQIANMEKLGIPSDEYPLLAEARGLAFNCPFQAIGSVRAEIEKIVSLMLSKNITPVFENWIKKDKNIDIQHEEILRGGLNKHIAYRNLNSLPVSRKNKSFISAGLHVSFTNPNSFNYSDKEQNKTFNYNSVFDFPHIFNKITQEFKEEIKVSERVPGFYEVKSDGRVEYRSLPATLIHNPNFAHRLAKCL